MASYKLKSVEQRTRIVGCWASEREDSQQSRCETTSRANKASLLLLGKMVILWGKHAHSSSLPASLMSLSKPWPFLAIWRQTTRFGPNYSKGGRGAQQRHVLVTGWRCRLNESRRPLPGELGNLPTTGGHNSLTHPAHSRYPKVKSRTAKISERRQLCFSAKAVLW